VSVFTEQAWVLDYLPGNGASGYIGTHYELASIISTGTNSIASNLVTYVLNPFANVTYIKISSMFLPTPLYTEPLSLVLARSIIVAAVYILLFMFISWFALKRAEVLE
jgi:hypothetical protein